MCNKLIAATLILTVIAGALIVFTGPLVRDDFFEAEWRYRIPIYSSVVGAVIAFALTGSHGCF